MRSELSSAVGVSVFIQTLNEEANIEACIRCFDWSDDVVVLDSFSSDRTVEIAKALGARVFQRTYDGRAANQNWAMDNIPFKHAWVYYSDADERVPRQLAEEIRSSVADADASVAAFRVRRRDYFRGRWIRHSTGYPLWIVRLFRPDRIRWSRKANPVPHIEGSVGTLQNDYLHYPFSKGIADWVDRHNRYSTYEAEETLRSLSAKDLKMSELVARDPSARRLALKRLSFRLPGRPLLKFFYLLVIKSAWRDGAQGLHYVFLQCFYEYLICLKVDEQRDAGRGGPDVL